jgi:hypothetical protein
VKRFIVFDSEGRLRSAGVRSGCGVSTTNDFFEVEHDGSHTDIFRSIAGLVTPKSANSAVLSGTTISNITLPARIAIEGVTHEVTDATVTLSFDFPGTYEVVVDPVSELQKTFMVTYP